MAKRLPTIDIKGKEYVMVKDRIVAFNEANTNGSIVTELVSNVDKSVIFKATVYPDASNKERFFTGYSEAIRGTGMMGAVPVEVAETSAVGRALAMYGIGIIESIASADEVAKNAPRTSYNAPNSPVLEGKITPNQVALIRKLCRERGIKMTPAQDKKLEGLTQQEASEKIEKLLATGVSNSNDKAKDAAERDIVGDDDIPVIEQD